MDTKQMLDYPRPPFGHSIDPPEEGLANTSSSSTNLPNKQLDNKPANDDNDCEDDQDEELNKNAIKFQDWGFKVDRLFEVAYRFYKRNESKAFHLTFDLRSQMNALILQARCGNFDGVKAPDVGVLDLVGKSRRHHWSLLKGMSKTEAMSKFIYTLDEICPIFKAHAEAVKISSNLNSHSINRFESTPTTVPTSNSITTHGNQVKSTSLEAIDQAGDSTREDVDEQLNDIRTSLNRQTYEQFKSYAEKQYPDDKTKRKQLITSLQEQYYQQYISQMQAKLSTSKENTKTDSQYIEAINTNGSNSTMITTTTPTTLITTTTFTESELKEPTYQHDKTEIKNYKQEQAALIDNNQSQSPSSQNNNNYESNLSNGLSSLAIQSNQSNQYQARESSAQISSLQHNRMQYNNELTQIPNSNLPAPVESTNKSPQETHNLPQNITNYEIPFSNNLVPAGTNQAPTTVNNNSYSDSYSRRSQHSQYQYDIATRDIGQFEAYPEPTPVANANVRNNGPFSIAINMFTSASSPANNRVPADTKPTEISAAPPSLEKPAEVSVPKRESPLDQAPKVFYEPEIFNGTKEAVGPPQLPIPFQQLPSPPMQQNEPQQAFFGHTEEQPKESMQESSQNFVGNTDNFIGSVQEYPQEIANQNSNAQLGTDEGGWEAGLSSGRASPMQDNVISYGPLEAASIWTKKGVVEFRESLMDDKQGGIQVVNQGSSMVIQVPTYPDGRFIHFEFCTEDYDIAFGLDFVFEMYLQEPLALRIYEESDTEDEDEYADEDETSHYDGAINHFDYTNDTELAMAAAQRKVREMDMRKELLEKKRAAKMERAANTVAIVPTYRRDSHQDLFIGRHRYPGQGYYLLKFDNTYSVLRSKTLFFRICYLM